MRLNERSIRQRLQKLELYIAELEKHQPIPLATLKADLTRQLAVERAFQAAIESCTDVASHVVSVYQLGHPESSRDVFGFLVEAGYLDSDFGDSMMAMVFEERPFAPWPMRNGLAARAIANADFNEVIFTSLRRDFEESLESRLPDIPCPVLIVWGDNDRILDVSAVSVMQQALPSADVVIMENMGHMPILERPQETAEYYRAFLQRQ